jgi:hypothetical protein
MNSRGQVGQLASSIPVLVFLVVLMGLFLVGAATVGPISKKSEGEVYNQQSAGSKALSDMFLSDTVRIGEKDLMVKQAIRDMISPSNGNGYKNVFPYVLAIQNLFAKSYSCDGKNSLIILLPASDQPVFSEGDTKLPEKNSLDQSYVRFIDYPSFSLKEGDKFPSGKFLEDVDGSFLRDKVNIKTSGGVAAISEGFSDSGSYVLSFSDNPFTDRSVLGGERLVLVIIKMEKLC